jgi:hypothetical protein
MTPITESTPLPLGWEKSPRLTRRHILVVKLRQNGLTYREIGKRFNVTLDRARLTLICAMRRIESRERWDAGFDTRILTALNWMGIVNREQLFDAMRCPTFGRRCAKYRNFGKKSYRILCEQSGFTGTFPEWPNPWEK